MMARVGSCLAVSLLLLASGNITAQVAIPLTGVDSGVVVRLHLRDGRREAGRLLARLHPGSTAAEYCAFPAPPCTIGSPRHVQRSLEDAVALDRYGGTRLGTGFAVGAALGGALGVVAIVGARDADGGTKVGLAYAALSVTLLAAVGALLGLTIPVWHPLGTGAT